MGFGSTPTKKGFEFDFFPCEFETVTYEATVEFHFMETNNCKISSGINNFELTFKELLLTLEYMIFKYSRASDYLNLTNNLNILSIVNGYKNAKARISQMKSSYPNQDVKKSISLVDFRSEEILKFDFDIEKENITFQVNCKTEKHHRVYLYISDFNRLIFKLLSLTDFGKNNQDIKTIDSELVILSDKQIIYLIETVNINKEIQSANDKFYQSVKDEVKLSHKIWNTFIEKIFSKD